jgi:proteasome lid subunit RPN8/RPN11
MTDGSAGSGAATADLVFAADAYERLIDHARDGAPAEVCGVLGGTTGEDEGEDDAGERRVDAALPVENVADRPRTRYELDPAEQLERIEAIEAEGGDVAGFYHSHPTGPAKPSATDSAQATWPGASYVIVDLRDERVGAWRWTGEAFAAETVRVARD